MRANIASALHDPTSRVNEKPVFNEKTLSVCTTSEAENLDNEETGKHSEKEGHEAEGNVVDSSKGWPSAWVPSLTSSSTGGITHPSLAHTSVSSTYSSSYKNLEKSSNSTVPGHIF